MERKEKDSLRKYKITEDKIKQRGRLGGGEEERIGGEVEEKDKEQPINKYVTYTPYFSVNIFFSFSNTCRQCAKL